MQMARPSRAAQAANCDEFVDGLSEGYGTMIGENGSRLSEGERQRISIAHRMRTVMNADKVVVLDGERVVEQGSPQDLLARDGLFARMVRLQNESAD